MIHKLIQLDEGKTIEFKENAKSLPGIIKTVVAFANTAGGTIIIGVEDRTKQIIGVPDALDEEKRLVNAISDSIAPFLVPAIEVQNYRNKELIIVEIPHLAGPFYVKKDGPELGVYVRSGSTNRVADAEMMDTLRLFARKMSFDETPCLPNTADTLDWPAIEQAFKNARRKITPVNAADLDLLVKYGTKEVPSRGGIILFGTNRLNLFPDAIIRCVRFYGTSKARVIDHRDITAYPVDALEEAIAFVERNTFLAAQIGRIYREDTPQYPPEAIREAITNAIVHTDYALKGTSIMIAIFDDRIEITNPGGLPLGMTLERALRGSSRVRNRVIARVFKELKLIEQWGSGIQRIIASCAKHGLQAPIFEDFSIEFQVTLYGTPSKEYIHEEEIDTTQQHIVEFLRKKKRISTQEAASLWNVTTRSSRDRLKKMVNAGLITKMSSSRTDPHSYYVLRKHLQ